MKIKIGDGSTAYSSLPYAIDPTNISQIGTSTVGSSTKPIYLSSGKPTACSGTVGTTARPVYMSSGTITACSSTVGSGTQPVYMSSGTITASTSTVGAYYNPVYLNAGVITAISQSVGSSTLPVYMSNGTWKACKEFTVTTSDNGGCVAVSFYNMMIISANMCTVANFCTFLKTLSSSYSLNVGLQYMKFGLNYYSETFNNRSLVMYFSGLTLNGVKGDIQYKESSIFSQEWYFTDIDDISDSIGELYLIGTNCLEITY